MKFEEFKLRLQCGKLSGKIKDDVNKKQVMKERFAELLVDSIPPYHIEVTA
jgi:hypothetical protein